MTRRVSRRGLLAGSVVAGALAVPAIRQVAARQTSPTLIATGDCTREPGVQLLVEWRLGVPVMRHEEMLPPLDWVTFSHPATPWFLLIPPDWTAYVAWANGFSRSGEPIWQDRQPELPQLTLLRLVSPGQDAAFEQCVGNIQGQPLTVPEGALVAQQGLLGELPRLREICHFDETSPLAPGWGYADRHESSVLVSIGNAFPLPDVFLPATTVTYQNMYGPRDRFEELMRTVFIPLLYQQLSGGDSDPTPTPTPGF